MKFILTISLLILGLNSLIAQKVRLEGDDSPYLCKNDSIADLFTNQLKKEKVDSTITILYDFDNGRLPNSRQIVVWTKNGLSYIKIIEGCDIISKDSIYSFNSTDLWKYIKTRTFEKVTVSIKTDKFKSHDKFYYITVATPNKNFFVVVRDYERKDNNLSAQTDTRVILANKIDKLIN